MVIMGLIGMGIDLAIFFLLLSASFSLGNAHILSFVGNAVPNYLLNAFATMKIGNRQLALRQFGRFWVIALMTLFLRGGVIATFTDSFGWVPQHAIIPAVAASAIIYSLGMTFWVFPPAGLLQAGRLENPVTAVAVVAYMVLLRLFYLGGPELLPQEAYYWIYAQHLDIGYLDHPPMVAWIIWVFKGVAGDTEIGVRFGAFFSWFVASYFMFKLTRNLFDRSTAFRVLLLLATLPFFSAAGFLMTPDAPLVACWAATLFYLERCLIGRRPLAWWGVGLWMGLGLLTKYTIAILIPGIMIFILVDRKSRGYLKSSELYLAVVLGFLLFLPVILWNARNNWISFVFQGSRRFQESFDFTLPALIGSILLLITPTGVMASLAFFIGNTKENWREWGQRLLTNQERLFAFVFTLLPFLMFLAFSLVRNAKLNWTGPLWLGVLPFIARQMSPETSPISTRFHRFLQRAWSPTFIVTVLISGGLLHFLTLGIAGLPYPQLGEISNLFGWKDLASQIEAIEDRLESTTGVEPIIVGMDKNKIASELTFYRHKQSATEGNSHDEALDATTGRQLFGMESLMFKYWAGEPQGRDLARKGHPLILVSREMHEFNRDLIRTSGWDLGVIEEIVVKKNGIPAGRYYYGIATCLNPAGHQ